MKACNNGINTKNVKCVNSHLITIDLSEERFPFSKIITFTV